ncbi:cyclic nucleotide-binding domain-containing protein [Acidisphaera sp. S103]|uniref:cyclic nucleotide-binding domain-containing protein n=1 Tax=Acidisphaera sp. S103 TaxID=1747223 RepID=UPI00131DF455|nr:cyclic nucleotide-binding domain-containing protein [Acidisphaera sp. S103]
MPSRAMLTEMVRSNQSDNTYILEALRATPLLRDLADPVLLRLAAISKILNAPEDVEICRQGDPAGELIIVLSGQLAGFSTAPNGTVAVVEVVRAGETLGLATLLARLPRLLGVRTVTPSSLISIEAEGLLTMVEQEPSLVAALLRAEANEFHALVRQVCDLKLRTTAQRLGCYLLSLSAEKQANATALRLPFDKRLLAARLGCRQENLSRAFAALRGFGVETHGARVILHDIASLTAYSEPDESIA